MDADTKRELQKAYAILLKVNRYFEHQTQMNAHLHMTQALHSPLASAVKSAVSSMNRVINNLNKEETD